MTFLLQDIQASCKFSRLSATVLLEKGNSLHLIFICSKNPQRIHLKRNNEITLT